MRILNGILRTLEQDINDLWEAHGWIVTSETVKGKTWTIRAKPKKNLLHKGKGDAK